MNAHDGIHTAVYPPGAIGSELVACLPLNEGDQLTVICHSHSALLREYGFGSYGVSGNRWKTGAELTVCDSLSEVEMPIHHLILPAPTYAMEQIATEISRCPASGADTDQDRQRRVSSDAHFRPGRRSRNLCDQRDAGPDAKAGCDTDGKAHAASVAFGNAV